MQFSAIIRADIILHLKKHSEQLSLLTCILCMSTNHSLKEWMYCVVEEHPLMKVGYELRKKIDCVGWWCYVFLEKQRDPTSRSITSVCIFLLYWVQKLLQFVDASPAFLYEVYSKCHPVSWTGVRIEKKVLFTVSWKCIPCARGLGTKYLWILWHDPTLFVSLWGKNIMWR